jgi:hypothetical protein
LVRFSDFRQASSRNATEADILTIDLPDEPADLLHLNPPIRTMSSSRNRVGRCYKGTPYERRITELKCDSRSLNLRNTINSADLILIDGGHDMTCIAADSPKALSTARKNTVVLWDDYFWYYPEAVKFLDIFSETHDMVRVEHTNLACCILN